MRSPKRRTTSLVKNSVKRDSFLLLWLIFFFFFSHAWAVPKDVTIYPQNARVTEVTKIRLSPDRNNFFKAVITIPPLADPASLVIYLPQEKKLRIEDISWHKMNFDENAKTKELRKHINQLKNDKNSLEASRLALDAQIQFWQQQIKTKVKNLAEAGSVASALGKNIKKAAQDRLSLATEAAILEKKIKESNESLKTLGNSMHNPWEITILLSGYAANETQLSYSYTLEECGWLPLYRLDANVQKKEIRVGWDAEVWQTSGEDWKEANLTLTNIQSSQLFSPPVIAPWIITTPQEKKKSKQTDDKKKTVAKRFMDNASNAAGEISESNSGADIIHWKIGKNSLPSGPHQRLKIHEEVWSADFSYFSRPSTNTEAFISASFLLPHVKNMPSGNALYLLNDTLIGKMLFTFKGKGGNIFFGADPGIIINRTMESQSVDKDHSGKIVIYKRQWRIDMENTRSFPIRLHIEEPLPTFSDGLVKVTLNHLPNPSEYKSTSLLWEVDLPSGEKKSILFSVDIEAPVNLEIDPGWG